MFAVIAPALISGEHDGLDGALHGESAYASASATARET
jgi:hypothetical protein